MDKVIEFLKNVFILCLMIPTLVLEYIAKIVWGILFFIFTPVMKWLLHKEAYRACRTYGSFFSLKDENFPATAFIRDMWEESK